ncbi:MAG: ABC transporter permease [Oscillospiraceae bacterium]|nr:ABC transporter permease [Oscillospiraceae bacterium]
MDSKIRLLRRPLTTALWAVLAAVMAAFLAVASALWWSSSRLDTVLDGYFTTIAVRMDPPGMDAGGVESGAVTLTQEDAELLSSLESVKALRFHSLTGGLIPELEPVIYTSATHAPDNFCKEYDVMLLDCTVDKADGWQVIQNPDGTDSGEVGYYVEATIHQKVCGSDDFPFMGDQMGFETYDDQIVLCFSHFPLEVAEQGTLVGQRLLLYGAYNHVIASRSINASDYTPFLPFFDVKAYCPFDGDAEAVFASEPDWALLREACEKGQHNFPVIGTDHLESMAAFQQNAASVTQGRSFTPEEYESGAKVLLLSEAVAERSSIRVGDTVTLSQYRIPIRGGDPFYNSSCFSYGYDGRLNNPAPGRFAPDTVLETQEERFTVVGLYRLKNQWEETSFSFTPNTVIIPRAAQIPGGLGGVSEVYEEVEVTASNGQTLRIPHTVDSAWGVYFSLELNNDKAELFPSEIEQTRFARQFYVYDQGAGKVLGSVRAVAGNANKLLAAAILGWLLLLALFVSMYQGAQRRNLGIMRSLGARPGACGRYLFLSGWLTALLGTALGTGASLVLLDRVQTWMLQGVTGGETLGKFSGGTPLTEEALQAMIDACRLGPGQLLLLAAAELAIFAAALALHAYILSRKTPRKLLGV